jgi:hypothetical protein
MYMSIQNELATASKSEKQKQNEILFSCNKENFKSIFLCIKLKNNIFLDEKTMHV